MFGTDKMRCPACRFILRKRTTGVLSCSRCGARINIRRPKIRKNQSDNGAKGFAPIRGARRKISPRKKTPALREATRASIDEAIGSTVSEQAGQILRDEMARELAARGQGEGALEDDAGGSKNTAPEQKIKDLHLKARTGALQKNQKPARAWWFYSILVVISLFLAAYIFHDAIANFYPPAGDFLDSFVQIINFWREEFIAFFEVVCFEITAFLLAGWEMLKDQF